MPLSNISKGYFEQPTSTDHQGWARILVRLIRWSQTALETSISPQFHMNGGHVMIILSGEEQKIMTKEDCVP
jgi:hypothetical protein